MTFAILYFFNTVPSVDSSIQVTIQSVVTRNMLNITVLVNVRKCSYINIIHSSNDFLLCKQNNVKQKCFCRYIKRFHMCLYLCMLFEWVCSSVHMI